MRASSSSAVLLVSVTADTTSLDHASLQPLTTAAESTLELLVENDIAATWGCRSPIDFPLVSAIVAHEPRQAMAVTLTNDGGPLMAEQLRRETLRARAGGLRLATVFSRKALSTESYQLLAKYGMSALHVTDQGDGARTSTSRIRRAGQWLLPMATRSGAVPQKLRWGLWRMPQAISLANEGAWRVRHAIDRAVATADMIHVEIDLGSVSAGARRQTEELASVVRQISSYSRQGGLQTQTLAPAATVLSQPRHTAAPACSILRRQAA
jgi:hypothetical protein